MVEPLMLCVPSVRSEGHSSCLQSNFILVPPLGISIPSPIPSFHSSSPPPFSFCVCVSESFFLLCMSLFLSQLQPVSFEFPCAHYPLFSRSVTVSLALSPLLTFHPVIGRQRPTTGGPQRGPSPNYEVSHTIQILEPHLLICSVYVVSLKSVSFHHEMQPQLSALLRLSSQLW